VNSQYISEYVNMLFIFIMYIYARKNKSRTKVYKTPNAKIWSRPWKKCFRASRGRFRASQSYFTFCSYECSNFVLFQ